MNSSHGKSVRSVKGKEDDTGNPLSIVSLAIRELSGLDSDVSLQVQRESANNTGLYGWRYHTPHPHFPLPRPQEVNLAVVFLSLCAQVKDHIWTAGSMESSLLSIVFS